ncbi:MAG TPA: hypothetical protein VFE47_10790 [Tepidisphaeraceae bacterium]|nr:hypothetical protein [Tepidisphaeraceae bacterium]
MDQKETKIDAPTNPRSVLIVLFVPSADREGRTLGSQDEWKNRALEFFGETYGGATAMPRAEGIWRDDEGGGNLVRDFPYLIHCYVTGDQVADKKLIAKLTAFARKMGREMKQGEIALVIDGQFHGLRHFG